MMHDTKLGNSLKSLLVELAQTQVLSRALLERLLTHGCVSELTRQSSKGAERIRQLITAEAWTDAALALVSLELPHWSMRRLVCEDGIWLCTLTRHPHLPPELDDTIDASHELLPIAILSALVEARLMRGVAEHARRPSVTQLSTNVRCVVCCDNFS